jgi:predicted nucleic acid-binding protein
MRFRVVENSVPVMRTAFGLSQRYKISFWDAAIVSAAAAAECDEILSEDSNSGQSYGGVRVVNPFR